MKIGQDFLVRRYEGFKLESTKELFHFFKQNVPGASEITANLNCYCVHLYWLRDLQNRFAVIYETRSNLPRIMLAFSRSIFL